MTDDFDEFFDDELAGAESVPEPASDNVAEADVRRPSAEPAALANSDPARPQRQSPPFWMVLAIAGISLVLGVVIGYLVGTTVTINELSSREPEAASEDASVEMPEGHPDIELDEEGNAKVVDGSAAPVSNDPLTLANNFFDMGMSAMNGAKSEEDQLKARDVFRQAIVHYDEYLRTTPLRRPRWIAPSACSTPVSMSRPSRTSRLSSRAMQRSRPHGRTSACSTNPTAMRTRPRRPIARPSTPPPRTIPTVWAITPASASRR